MLALRQALKASSLSSVPARQSLGAEGSVLARLFSSADERAGRGSPTWGAEHVQGDSNKAGLEYEAQGGEKAKTYAQEAKEKVEDVADKVGSKVEGAAKRAEAKLSGAAKKAQAKADEAVGNTEDSRTAKGIAQELNCNTNELKDELREMKSNGIQGKTAEAEGKAKGTAKELKGTAAGAAKAAKGKAAGAAEEAKGQAQAAKEDPKGTLETVVDTVKEKAKVATVKVKQATGVGKS